MKFLLGRMLGSMGNCTWGTWRALLLLRMKILPGRTALKTLDPMAPCTDHCLLPFLGVVVLNETNRRCDSRSHLLQCRPPIICALSTSTYEADAVISPFKNKVWESTKVKIES